MKKSVSYWMFPGVLAGNPVLDFRRCLHLAREAGFEAVELSFDEKGLISMDSTKEDMEKVVRTAKDVGVELSSLATGLFWEYSLTSNDASIREKAKGIVRKMLELASYLKVDTVLVVPGAVDVFFKPDGEIVPYDLAYERALSALKELAPGAEKYRVNIGIENVWNKFLLSPLEMSNFIDQIGNKFVGAYFDVGNVLLTGYPDQWIRILGKRIKKVHIKDFKVAVGNINGFVNLLEGNVDWQIVMNALEEVGYDDYITAEILPPYGQHAEALIHNTSKAMDFILGRV